MQYLTDNTRITGLMEVSPPNEVTSEMPISPGASELVFNLEKKSQTFCMVMMTD